MAPLAQRANTPFPKRWVMLRETVSWRRFSAALRVVIEDERLERRVEVVVVMVSRAESSSISFCLGWVVVGFVLVRERYEGRMVWR